MEQFILSALTGMGRTARGSGQRGFTKGRSCLTTLKEHFACLCLVSQASPFKEGPEPLLSSPTLSPPGISTGVCVQEGMGQHRSAMEATEIQ